MPMMGATAPGSLLATTLLANCETLGVLCLVQAAEPGTPFIYAPIALTMDPRSGRYAGNTATRRSAWPAPRWRATTGCR